MTRVLQYIPVVLALVAQQYWLAAFLLVSTAASQSIAARQARRQARQARDAFNNSLVDRLQMVRGSIGPRELALGRVRKGGQIAFIGSAGSKKEKLNIVLVLAAHEIDAVEQVYLNDEPVTIASGVVTSQPWATPVRNTLQSVFTTVTGSAADNSSGSVTLSATPIGGTVRLYAIQTSTGLEYDLAPFATIAGTSVSVTDIPFLAGTAVYVTYEANQQNNWVRIRWYLGTSTQGADAGLIADFPGVWTTDHRLRGCAYMVVEMYYNDDVFVSGIPNVSATIRGAKVFDPRTSTTAWSENVALLMRHYAISPLGGRLDASLIDDTSVIAAANVCDTSTVFNVVINGVPTNVTRALFTAGYVASTSGRPKDALDDLVTAMAGKWCFAGNKLTVKAGGYTSPVLTLVDGDFADATEMQVQPTRSREDLINLVTGAFSDADNGYRLVDMPRVVASAYITADGAELPLDIEFTAITRAEQAQHVAGIMLRDSRQALTVVASFKMAAYVVQVLDVVALTNARYGWAGKAFEVLSRRWTLEGLIELTLKETGASIYALAASFDAVDVLPNTLLPSPWYVEPLTGLSVTSNSATLGDGTTQTRMLVSWTAHPNQAVLQTGEIEVAFLPAATTLPPADWPSQRCAGSATSLIVTGLKQGGVYLVRARAHTTNTRSAWTALQSVTISNALLNLRPNLQLNGGFEDGLNGWTGDVGNLAAIDNVWGRVVNNVAAFSGTGVILGPPIPVAAGDWYTVTGDSLLFATSGSVYFDLHFFNSSNALILDGGQNPIAATHDFVTSNAQRSAHAVEARAPTGAIYARARFVWFSVVGGTALGCRQIKVERGRLPATQYSNEASASALIGTTRLAIGSATSVYSGSAVGPALAAAGGTNPTYACPVAFTPDSDGTVIVTGVMTASKSGPAKSTLRAYLNQGTVLFGNGNDPGTSPTGQIVRWTFPVVAGVPLTCGILLTSNIAAGSAIGAEDMSVTAELIKR